jgi:formylglycine-generating enzyme required for sulfatase activity
MRKGLCLLLFLLLCTVWNFPAGKQKQKQEQKQEQFKGNDTEVLINGGTFTMGSAEDEAGRSNNEGPQRQVTVASFFMGKYEITQKEFEELMGINNSFFKGDMLPVENVSWFEAVEYCNRRSKKEKLIPAYIISGSGDNLTVVWDKKANGYRLPTEAEWEYACRAGTSTPFYTGNNITTKQANYNGFSPYDKNAKGVFLEKTTPVGAFEPNPWGLYDMPGNVLEWCWDWYADSYGGGAVNASAVNPAGAASGSFRIIRGGSWAGTARGVRSAFRGNNIPTAQNSYLGFRIARNVR